MKIYYLMDYLPVRYDATPEQEDDRQAIFDFKDGDCPGTIIDGLAACINQHKGTNTVVCSVPASTREKTILRYLPLSTSLPMKTGIPFSCTAIIKEQDSLPGHIAGRREDPAEDFLFNTKFFSGKDVILIDDVLTRGRTLESTAMRLLHLGAKSVIGLVAGRTINPDWDGPENRDVERVVF